MSELLIFVALTALPAPIAASLTYYRPQWSDRRIFLLAATPVPLIGMTLSLFVFARAVTASPEQCGVDACGMAAAAAVVGAGLALCIFVLGLLSARGARWGVRRSAIPSDPATFE